MGSLDGWDISLLLGATYIGVITLVRLMVRRRDQVVSDVQQQLEAHRKKAKAAKDKKSSEAA